MTGTSEELAARVRSWFEANAPVKGSAGDFSTVHIVSAISEEEYREREQYALTITREWLRRLLDAGLVRRSWAVEYGGAGEPAWHDEVVVAEQARWGVSTKMLAVGLEMLPGMLFAHGTEGQRRRYLPPATRGEEVWCQLVSEPDAGSDLGSIRTTATPVHGGWVVNGQKVWTSGAGVADLAMAYARTEPGSTRQAGISCLIVDMHDPGVAVRPLRQMSGAYHFNEVFLDGVFVPEDGAIGALGDGWSVLRTMLAAERAAVGGGTSARSANQLVTMVRERGLGRDRVVRQEVATVVIRERILDMVGARVALGQVPAGGSVSKLLYSEHARRTADAATNLLGPAGTVTDDGDGAAWIDRLLFAPGLRIGGGTDEIQRNTIGEQGLGLPREPKPRAS